MRTKRGIKSTTGTRKNKGSIQKFEQEIVTKFLSFLNTVKIYHWKTHSYATHKATYELYSKLNDNMDKFVEVLLGKMGNRVDMSKIKALPIRDFSSLEQMRKCVVEFKEYLVGLNVNRIMKTMNNSDLYNIRDELLSDLDQFLYLTTFNG
jgi:DNA-binding ferritin-like protein